MECAGTRERQPRDFGSALSGEASQGSVQGSTCPATGPVLMSRIPATALTAAMQTLIPEVIVRIHPRTFISNRALWRELSSCVLGSQVPHEVARAATRELDRLGLLYSTTIETDRRKRKSLVRQIEVVLSQPFNTAL